jgi:hypothetical protein
MGNSLDRAVLLATLLKQCPDVLRTAATRTNAHAGNRSVAGAVSVGNMLGGK